MISSTRWNGGLYFDLRRDRRISGDMRLRILYSSGGGAGDWSVRGRLRRERLSTAPRRAEGRSNVRCALKALQEIGKTV